MHGVSDIIIYLSIGMYLCLFLYYIAVYSGRRSDSTNLHFSLLMLALAMFVVSFEIMPKLPNYNTWPVYAFRFIANTLVGCFVTQFGYSIVGPAAKKYSAEMKLLMRCILFGLLLAVVISFFVPPKGYPIITAVYLIPIGIWSVSFSIRLTVVFFFSTEKPFREKWRLQIVIGMLIFIAALFSQMLMLLLKIPNRLNGIVLHCGAILLSLISAGSLANRFNKEHDQLIEMKDMLELKVTERTIELQKAKDMIEAQGIEKTAFFVNLAHETRTPATLIQNYLDKCIIKYPNDDNLQVVKRNIDKLVRDMVNFLDAEKIQQGRLSYDERERFDLSRFLNNKADLVQATAEMRGLRVNRSIDSNIEISSNVHAMDRIINNLLDNAMKYTPKGGSITLELKEPEEDFISIMVADTGVGIPEEKQAHIFDKYYQISHNKGNTQGIGMGLFIAKSIVENLDGQISLVSSASGTNFIVKLPKGSGGEYQSFEGIQLTAPVIISENDKVIENLPIDDSKETVLLVEDNIDLVLTMKESLAAEYNVFCAKNGKEALCILDSIPVNIIVSDVMMDVMDGYELLEQVRKREGVREVPFVFLTAKSGVSEEIKGLKSGAVDYIQKPFAVEALKARIGSLLEYNLLKKKSFQLEKYRSIGMMTASISHEILNPLSGITGPLYILEKELKAIGNKNGEAVNIALEHIKKNVGRIDNIVTTLKDLFHGDDLKLEPIQLIETIEPIIKMFQEKVGKTIIIEEEIPRDFHIYSNKSAITQIIINLISNSIDAITSNKGLIRVIARTEDGKKSIQVTDNGVGIDPLNIDKIFNLNFTTKKKGQGTGMGLYIVKELTNKLRLTISVDSVINKGSTFTIREVK